jgi:hypothetical protein
MSKRFPVDSEVFRNACKALERYCKRNGYIYDNPSELASEQDENFLYLKNNHRDLGEYNLISKRLVVPKRIM